MNASVILAHPYSKSFNHAIFQTVCETFSELGVKYTPHDLYEEEFNPVLTKKELGSDQSEDVLVNQYAKELVNSDILVFIHPNWWGQPPAILKGYVDRVIRPPYAYDFPKDNSGGGLPIEKLKGKFGIVYNTSNTEMSRENNYFGDPLENIWKKCVFGFCGIRKYHRRMFRIIADSSETDRKTWLKEIKIEITGIISKISNIVKAISQMKKVFQDIPYGIEHTLKVLENAEEIMERENYPSKDREKVSLIAVLHDIGAVEAQKKYGSIEGKYQEIEGPAIAQKILQQIGYDTESIERICYIIGNHHSPSQIDGPDFQIQWEADLLENIPVMDILSDKENLTLFIDNQFKTQSGKAIAYERFL